MRRLFNEFTAEDEIGRAVSDQVEQFMDRLLDEFPSADLNDLEVVVYHTVSAVTAEKRMRFARIQRMDRRLEETERQNEIDRERERQWYADMGDKLSE